MARDFARRRNLCPCYDFQKDDIIALDSVSCEDHGAIFVEKQRFAALRPPAAKSNFHMISTAGLE
jgi:hypothetical protein